MEEEKNLFVKFICCTRMENRSLPTLFIPSMAKIEKIRDDRQIYAFNYRVNGIGNISCLKCARVNREE